MTYPWLHEQTTWRGSWWLPEDPGNQHAGFLSYSPGSGLELTLVGGFDDMIWEPIGPGAWAIPTETRNFPAIHGFAGNQPVTLFEARSVSSKSYGLGFFEGGPSEQTIRSQRALVGVHATSTAEGLFDHADCVIEDSWSWSGDSAMTGNIQLDAQKRFTGEATIELTPVDEKSISVNGVEVTLSHSLTLPSFDPKRGGARGHVEDKAVFTFTPEQPFSLTEALSCVTTVQDLLALATGRGPALLWLSLYVSSPFTDRDESSEELLKEVHVYTHGRDAGDPDAKSVDAHDLVFTLKDLPFETLIPRWWEVRDQFRASCNTIIGSRYAAEPYIETMLITAATAAESFHKDLGEAPPMARKEMDALVQRAVDAMPDDRKDWIRSVIPRGHSLRQRLDRLAERIPKMCRDRLLPDADEWAKATTRARNDLSHSGTSAADVERLYAVVRVTRAVVLVNILIELGLREDRLLKAITYNSELSGACQLAARHFSRTA